MSDYRRYFVPGGTYFFTVVTERRAPLFADERARVLLGDVMRKCAERHPAGWHWRTEELLRCATGLPVSGSWHEW